MTTALARRAPRVLFASVPIGSGHRRAADAAKRALASQRPDAVTQHIDVMEYVKPFARDMVLDGYATLLQIAPRIWGYVYEHDEWFQRLAPIEAFKRHFQRDRFEALVRDFAPDLFVSSHPLCTVPMAALKLAQPADTKMKIPIVTLVTDYHVHESWLQRGVTLFVVGNDGMAPELTGRGIRAEQVRPLGIPIARAFGEPKDVAALKAKWGLDPAKPVALFLLKGIEPELVEKALFQISLVNRPIEVLFNTAGNDAVGAVLRRTASLYGVRARMFGFVDNLDDYVAAADVVMTKPGGLTSSECLALGVPMLLVSPIPGQEERNAAWLVERGVAKRVGNILTLGAELEVLLGGGVEMARMRERSKALGRPHAADGVAKLLIEIAENPRDFLKLEEPPLEPARREPALPPHKPLPSPPSVRTAPKRGELEEIGESWTGPAATAAPSGPARDHAGSQREGAPWTPRALSPRASREYLAGLILVEKDLTRKVEDARDDVAKWEKRNALARARGDSSLVGEAERRLDDSRRDAEALTRELERILARKAAAKGVAYQPSAAASHTASSVPSIPAAYERRDETPLSRASDDPEAAFRNLEVEAELKALKEKLEK